MMKNSRKIILIISIILVVIIVLCIVIFKIYNSNEPKQTNEAEINNIITTNNEEATLRAVVVKVNNNSLYAINLDNANSLCSIGFGKDGNIGLEQGQEILVHFDGAILDTYPEQLSNVEKIEIVKEESNVEIPEDVLRYCYSSRDNVQVSIEDFTKTGLSITIKDTNEYKYDYSKNEYRINKKNKEAENITVDTNKITPATENSTSSYDPGETTPLWEEAPKVSDEDTIATFNQIDDNTVQKNCDWTSAYGNLGEGEYEFVLTVGELGFSNIKISFNINSNGQLSYDRPTLE